MQFFDFKSLPVSAQAHHICQRGVLLAERQEDNCHISLYQLDAFYVEVYYRLHDNEIVKFISFHHTFFLEPYLKQVPLERLLPEASYY